MWQQITFLVFLLYAICVHGGGVSRHCVARDLSCEASLDLTSYLDLCSLQPGSPVNTQACCRLPLGC